MSVLHVTTATYRPTFYGNPNVSASNIAGTITSSKNSGVIPCFVQVSASAFTATGTSRPYEDLEYRWDFGDPTGTETFVRPTDGATVNANDAQVTPEASYVYRTPGTKTITVYVRGKTGGSVIATKTITVSDWGPSDLNWTVRYADSTKTGGANTGLTTTDAFYTIAAINTFIGSSNNKVLHVAKGSTWVSAVGLKPWENSSGTVSGLRIDTYGSGSAPVFEVDSGLANFACSMVTSTPSARSDCVISGIIFKVSGTADLNGNSVIKILTASPKTLSDIYFDNVTATSTVSTTSQNMVNAQGGTMLSKVGLWNCTLSSPQIVSAGKDSQGIFCTPETWFFFVGGLIEGGTGQATDLEHHIYCDVQQHNHLQWIAFGLGPNRNYCINGNNLSTSALDFKYWSISENDIANIRRTIDGSDVNNNATVCQLTDAVTQRNAMRNLLANNMTLFYGTTKHTFRDNRVWGNAQQALYVPDGGLGSLLQAQIYRNKIFIPSTTAGSATFKFETRQFTATFNTGNTTITASSPSYSSHPAGLAVKLSGSPPSPFDTVTQYYVGSSPATFQFTLSLTPGGAAIQALANGTATAKNKWTSPQTITDNIIVDDRASNPYMIDFIMADHVAAGSVLDRNQYFSRQSQTDIFLDNAVEKTLTELRTAGDSLNWEDNSSVSDPGWTYPVTQWSHMG